MLLLEVRDKRGGCLKAPYFAGGVVTPVGISDLVDTLQIPQRQSVGCLAVFCLARMWPPASISFSLYKMKLVRMDACTSKMSSTSAPLKQIGRA